MPTADASDVSVMAVGVMPAVDAGHGPCNGGPCGVVAMPDSGGRGPCNGGPCGVVVMPVDASEASWVGGGVLPSPDSGGGPCNGGPCGVIIHPEAGSD